jgi:hypothetical protein
MSGVTFERLPPERRITAPSAAAAGGCCCCCCCCLHTVGSVVGALSAKTPKVPDNPVPTAVVGTAAVEPSYTVTKEYWATVLVLTLVGFPLLVFAMYGVEVFDGEPVAWAIVYALVFPGIQLAASLVVAVRNAYSSRPGKDERMKHLGSITLRSFIGGLIGIAIMIPMFGLL